MTPPGIHINKTALAIICGLVFLAVLGFKYHTGSETVVSKFNDKNQGAEKFDLGSLNREAKKPLIGWQKETDAVEITKQRVTSVTKSIMQTQVIKEDWKKVDIDTVKIPDEIEKKVKELNVVQKTYKVMELDIFTRSVKPTVECKGGVLLLHGQAFTSKNWEDIKTLHYIAAMGYTPIAVDLPKYGQSEKKEVGDKGKFIEALLKVINFTKPVIISPSMSGTFSLPFLLRDADNVDKKVSGYIPVAPVIPKDNRERIKDLKMPAALVYGEKDTTLGQQMEDILSKMPNSRLFKIKDAGHAAYMNQPEVWHKILYVFIRAAYNYN